MASVFLSYDRDDAAKARPIAAALEKAGHSVWWDKRISGGSQFAKEIEQALDGADVVVVLWTSASVESPWVRDEAGSGRDRGRLVPLSLEGTAAPLGFRQYQSIDLGRWNGRGKVPQLSEILGAIQRQAAEPATAVPAPPARATLARDGPSLNRWAVIAVGIGMFFVIVGLLVGRPWEKAASGPATVSVAPADDKPLSNSIAGSVAANIGSLQGNPGTNFHLVDAASNAHASLQVSVAAVEAGGGFDTSVAVISRTDKAVLWSKQMHVPAERRPLLGQIIAFAAARPLGCAADLWSLKSGHLNADARRTYLKACAELDEVDDPRSLISDLRKIVQGAPAFAPAWAKLITAETNLLTSPYAEEEGLPAVRAELRRDIDAARKIDPDLPEAAVAEVELAPPTAFLQSIARLDEANSRQPGNPIILDARSNYLQRVGRMDDAVDDARRASEIAPYSPLLRSSYVRALAYGGGIEKAWAELATAKQLWPDSPAVQDADFALNLRFGNFEKAWIASGRRVEGGIAGYFKILSDPTDANIDAWIKLAKTHRLVEGERSFVYQALPAINRVDQDFAFIDEWPVERDMAGQTYFLFRPWMRNLRRDPRFMRLAKRLGLVDYWERSGKWPDFCIEADLPYECKDEAAKLT
jgi:tetratricopeptide (TPR) repeat protein